MQIYEHYKNLIFKMFNPLFEMLNILFKFED